jgi:hypothetical protein
MTVASLSIDAITACNGATTTFAVDFPMILPSDLNVYLLSSAIVDLTGLTPLSLGDDYVLSGDYGAGTASIVTATAYPTGKWIYRVRSTSVDQPVDVQPNNVRADTLESGLDRPILILQELWGALGHLTKRALLFPVGEDGATLPPAAARANTILGFDAFGALKNFTIAMFKGDKGDPGANVMAIGPWSSFEGLSIPIGTDLVQTADTLAAGSSTGTASARYKLDPEQTTYTAQMQAYIAGSVATGTPLATAQASATAFQRYWRRQSANGRWFTLAEPEPWSGMFGTPGDGGQDFNNVMSGTDVWANMQAFFDYCIYIARCKGRINLGGHRGSRGWQHGYGKSGYVGGVFEGAGQAYSGGATFPGTTLFCDTDEDPILNVSGDRDIVWDGVAFVGKLPKHLLNTTIAYPSSAPVAGYDSLDPQAWVDPSLRPSQDGTNNPYALVTLGAYDGGRPTSGIWTHGVNYGAGNCVRANGNVYKCLVDGLSAASGTGPSGTGNAIVDNGTKWRYLGAWDGVDGGLYVAYREPYRPAWLMNPETSAYNNTFSGSFATFRNCTFRGGNVGVAIKPCTDASQDDFTSFERCNFTECSFGLSAGNHQLRNLNVQSCNFGILQCALTSNTHGAQSGSFKAGHINCCGFGASVDVFRTDSSYGEPLVFTACYAEAQFRLGQITGSAAYVAGFSPVFIGCEWSFSGVHIARGRAPRQLYNVPDGSPNVNETAAVGAGGGPVFLDCRINVDGAFGCFIEGTKFINSQIYNYDRGPGTVAPYLAAFDNATAGGLILPGLEYRVEDQRLKFVARDLDSGAPVGNYITVDGYRFSDRSTGIPAMVKTVRAKNGLAFEQLAVPHEGPLILSKPTFTVSFPGADPTELKLVFVGSTQPFNADLQGFGPGSVVLESTTGTVFAVRYYDDATDTLYAVALNNYKIVAGVKSFLFPISTTLGSFAFLHARNYTPATPLFGDFTSGNGTIANVATSAGVGSTIQASIAVGDYLASPPELRAYAPETAKVTARANGSPGSITLDQNASQSVTKSRLAFFRRPTPANV